MFKLHLLLTCRVTKLRFSATFFDRISSLLTALLHMCKSVLEGFLLCLCEWLPLLERLRIVLNLFKNLPDISRFQQWFLQDTVSRTRIFILSGFRTFNSAIPSFKGPKTLVVSDSGSWLGKIYQGSDKEFMRVPGLWWRFL